MCVWQCISYDFHTPRFRSTSASFLASSGEILNSEHRTGIDCCCYNYLVSQLPQLLTTNLLLFGLHKLQDGILEVDDVRFSHPLLVARREFGAQSFVLYTEAALRLACRCLLLRQLLSQRSEFSTRRLELLCDSSQNKNP